jgi:2-polyprenyl-3-methyl-5-hydroxy-6-metoxy-1,4-benzoquinol methylase
MNTAAINCVICRGTDSHIIEKCKKGFHVLKCLHCGLVFVSPHPQKELIESAHSDDYYAPWLNDQRSRRIRMWEKRLQTLNSLAGHKGRLLDVGCAEGLFLEQAVKDGWSVTGTEISPFAVRHGKEKLSLNVMQGELADMKFPDDSFDAVTMWHVLEHTVNPVGVLSEIRRVLKDDGVFVMAIPNLDNILSQFAYRLIRGRRIHLFDPDDRELHLYHFTPRTIRMASEKAGFHVQKILPDMGIVQWHIKGLNHIAAAGSRVIGRIITDAIEIHLRPV